MFKDMHNAGLPLKEFGNQFSDEKDKKIVSQLRKKREEVKNRAKEFQDEQALKPKEERLSINNFRETLNEDEKLLFDDIKYVLEKKRAEKEKEKVETAPLDEKRPRSTSNSATPVQSAYVQAPTIILPKTRTRVARKPTLRAKIKGVLRSIPYRGRKPAPPGYRFIDTPPDGDCMFYSVFQAWFPELGVFEALQPSAAVVIREFIQDHAEEDDFYDVEQLLEDIDNSIGWRSGDVSALQQSFNSIIADSSPKNVLAEYKKVIMLQSFWGADREIYLLNKYGPLNGFPRICIYNSPNDIYQLTWTRGCAPIHYNGYNHYSILQKIPGKNNQDISQENVRERYMNLLEMRSMERETLASKRGKVRTALRTAYMDLGGNIQTFNRIADPIPQTYETVADANSTAQAVYDKALIEGATQGQAQAAKNAVKAKIIELQGGKRYQKTRKNRKSKGRPTRKH